MSNPNRTLRMWLKWSHIVSGSLMATVVYSPLRMNEGFVLLTQLVLLPVLILTGVSMVRAKIAASR